MRGFRDRADGPSRTPAEADAVADARRFYAQAVALSRKDVRPRAPRCGRVRLGLAQAQAMSGDPASALDTAASAETTSRDHLRLMLASLPERQSLNYAATRPRGLDVILSMIGADARAATIGLDEVTRNRASVLDEMAARRSGIHAAGEDAGTAGGAGLSPPTVSRPGRARTGEPLH